MVLEKRLFRQYNCLVSSLESQRTVVLKHLSSNRNEEIGFGRFLRNPRVTMERLLKEITSSVSDSVAGEEILLIQDTTELGFGLNSGILGIGKAGSGIADGFYNHPVIALNTKTKHCYGLAHCHIYNQNHDLMDAGLTPKERKRLRNHIPFEQKDSYRWQSSIVEAQKVCQNAQNMTVIADREGDIYQALVCFREQLKVDFLIRMNFNRPVESDISGQKIQDVLALIPFEHSYKINLPATDQRNKHEAQLQVRWTPLDLKRPEHKQFKHLTGSVKVNVVEVKEDPKTVVNHQDPVHWILLTSHPINTFEDAYQVIQWYTWRWFIEQLFRLLKSQGLNLLQSTLTTYEALSKLSLMALDAAIRVLQLLIARDSDTLQNTNTAFSDQEIEALTIISPTLEGNTDKLKNPYSPNDLKFAIWVIARLAGWSGYQKQSPPGPITLHRGVVKFKQMFEGFILAKEMYQKSD